MSSPGHPESATSVLNERISSRPKTLLQRLLSEIVHVLPSLRTSTSIDGTANSSLITLRSALEPSKTGVSVAGSDVTPASRPNRTAFPKLEQPCPYDPNTYHSFTSIEKRRRTFYSMREPQMKQSEPCLACRTGSIDLHISIDRGKACHSKGSSACNDLEQIHLAGCSSSNRLGSRPATPERAAKRVDSQLKRSRSSSSRVISSAPKVGSILDPLSGPPFELIPSLAEIIHTHDHDVGDKGEMDENLVCPKVKTRNDLSYSEDLPFVHRNEISLHAPTSHVTGRSTTTKGLPDASEELEFLDTVGCGKMESFPHIVLTRTPPLESQVMSAKKQAHVVNEPVRLRGGSGRDQGVSSKPSSKFKRWNKLCNSSRPEDLDPDSDAHLSRVCVEEPVRVVKTQENLRGNLRRKTNGAKPLPVRTSQVFQRTCSVRETRTEVADQSNRTSFTTTISGPPNPKPPSSFGLLSRLLLKYRYKRVGSSATQPKRDSLSRAHSQKLPHLRGGAESPERTPPSLYWLAGGTSRKPVSFDGWRQSRLKQRMGGLFGMAVFGNKYGQEYKVQASVSGDLVVECSASVKVTMEGTTEVVHVSAGADTPRPKSRSGLCQSEAAEAQLVEEAAAVAGEAATIEPTPGKAISRDVEETAPIKPIQRALSPPPASPTALIKPVPAGEASEGGDKTAPIESEEAIQRALSPPAADLADGIPLCSGALPVENDLHTPHEDDPPVHHSQEDKKEHDAASEGGKE